MPRSPDELRALVEDYLEGLELWPQLHGQAESVRYSITVGGKRVRPVICLATAEAAGAEPEEALAAGCALELVHTFSLVHDDLPSLDNDEERRGQPSTWKQYGEAVGILAGDALLAEAFRLATSYDTPLVARELAHATLGMIGGQYLDITGTAPDEATLHRLKTGLPLRGRGRRSRSGSPRVPEAEPAAVARVRRRARAALPDRRRHPRRRRLRRHARRRRRAPARRRVGRPRARALGAIDADTSVLRESSTGSRCARRDVGPMKKRIDVLLVERGLAESRAQAQALVMAGLVPGYDKPGQQVDESAELSVERGPAYVSRGGEKLAHGARPARRRPGGPRLPRRRRVDRRLHRRPAPARRGARDRASTSATGSSTSGCATTRASSCSSA